MSEFAGLKQSIYIKKEKEKYSNKTLKN